MNSHDPQYYVSKLGLTPHQEGGYYKEIFRSTEMTSDQELTVNFEWDAKALYEYLLSINF